MNQPFESKRPKQYGKEVSNWSESGPKEVDGFKEMVKVFKGDLEKKNENDSDGDEDGEDQSFWQGTPGALKNPFPKVQLIFVSDWRSF